MCLCVGVGVGVGVCVCVCVCVCVYRNNPYPIVGGEIWLLDQVMVKTDVE